LAVVVAGEHPVAVADAQIDGSIDPAGLGSTDSPDSTTVAHDHIGPDPTVTISCR